MANLIWRLLRGCIYDLGFAANALKIFGTVLAIFWASLVAGPIEGTFWPVTDYIHISKMTPRENGWTYIWGSSVKYRAGCRFDHIEWYIGLPGDDVRVDVDTLASPINRPAGAFNWGPWKVQLTPEQITDRSHAVMFHRCHDITFFGKTLIRLWMTETSVWPKREGEPKR